MRWKHIAGYMAQQAALVIPDLEYLERQMRNDGQTYRADAIRSRITMIRIAAKSVADGRA
jgi:hypothetical protein